MIGQRVGHFDFLESLGEGGMGVVYKARDVELGRLVAIKVLSGSHSADSERRLRFIQEARAASALNHPNIVTIYEIFRDNETDFIAMELITGKTLDQVIHGKAMKLSEALQIASQIADALKAAHAAGITHRDLKPGNIMLTAEGRVKVLDFGLAKLTERTPIGQEEATLVIQSPKTESGTILGTIAYMSPEQAEAKDLDWRSDIFSFGSVLYEMLTGRKAFSGESKVSTLSAILTAEPKSLEQMPAELDRILRRCLRKDREKRFQHMDDVKVALDEIREDSELGRLAAPALVPSASAPTRKKMLWAGLAAVLLVAAAVGGWVLRRESGQPPNAQGPSLRQITFDPGLTQEPTLWPAGNMIAYSSDRAGNNLDIWIQHLETKESKRLTTNLADDREPAFSPDGSRIAFRSERDGGGIYVVSALGGEERRIADNGRGPRFSPDGKWIAYYTGLYSFNYPFAYNGSALFVVDAAGGSPKRIASSFMAVSQPVWSPDSKSLLFMGGPKFVGFDWWAAPISEGDPIRVGIDAFREKFREKKLRVRDPRGWDGDFIFFLADVADSRNIWKVRVDPKTSHIAGNPERVTFGQGHDANPWVSKGRILFTNLVENSDIWSLPIDANQGKVLGEPKRITTGVAPEYSSDVSADGRFVVFLTQRNGIHEVIWKDLETGEERTLLSNWQTTAPMISPDGSWVAVSLRVDGNRLVQVLSAKGGAPKTLCDDCAVRNWAADGKRLLISKGPNTGLLDPTSGATNLFLPLGSYRNHSAPRMLPDDRWIVWYTATGNDHSRMFIAPVKEGTVPEREWIPVTDGSAWDVLPAFSPDGKTLYFMSQRDGFRCYWAMKIDVVTRKPAGQPYPVHHFHSARLSPAYVRVGLIESDVARDKIVFTMAERTGNIWLADLDGKK
ncbi:MAG: protein kinase [Acidobacteria bacterium]|nr:protein kinase [Acidobacteriota bacterium]